MKKETFIYSVLIIAFSFTSLSFTPIQINKGKVIWTQVVQMDAEQAFSTSESKGLFIFKLTSDMKLTYKYIVKKIDEGDMIMAGHIHFGAAGVEGGHILVGLTNGIQNLREFQTIQLTPEQYNILLDEQQALYVNVHTMLYPGDSIRGQIR